MDRSTIHDTLVNALVALSVARVGTWVLVVEFSQRGCVKMRRNAQHPSSWDGVERLSCGLASAFGY